MLKIKIIRFVCSLWKHIHRAGVFGVAYSHRRIKTWSSVVDTQTGAENDQMWITCTRMGCGRRQGPSRARCPQLCRGRTGCSQPNFGQMSTLNKGKGDGLKPRSIPHGLHEGHHSLWVQGHTLHHSQELASQCSPWRQGMVCVQSNWKFKWRTFLVQ